MHFLDDDTQQRSRVRRRSTDDFRVRGPERKRTVEVLDHQVVFDLGVFLEKPYEFAIRIGEIPLYRGKRVGRGERLAWTRGDTRCGNSSRQRAARPAVLRHKLTG
jgi:hypothetical protein